MQNDDLLDDVAIPHNETTLAPKATQGKRFGNYLIDQLMLFGFNFVLAFLIGGALLATDNGTLINGMTEDSAGIKVMDYVLGAIGTVIFYTLLEYLTGGKTIGKYVTKTRAIRNDGGRLTFRDALLRSLSRIVPFEPFSYLGDNGQSGWHDKWTDTRVVED